MPFLLAALAAAAGDCPMAPNAPPARPIESPMVLLQDTPVELMAVAEVSTAKAQPGTPIKLRVHRPIEVDGRPVIPVGTPAFGEVVTAKDSGGLGKSGRMTAQLLCIRYGDVAIPLEGQLSAKGRGAGSAGVAVVLSGVMGLFHRGNNAKIKAGEIVTAYVAGDVALGPPAAEPAPAPAEPPPVPAEPAEAP